MFGLHRVRFAFVAAWCVFVAGCGGGSTYVPASNQYGALQTASVVREAPAAALGDAEAFAESSSFFTAAGDDAAATADSAAPDVDSDLTISGTYDGSLTEKVGGVTIKGTVVVTLVRKASAVRGKFVFSYKGHKSTVKYTGTGHQSAGGFAMSLLLVNSEGCTATGPATVVKMTLSGSFKAPACKGETPSTGTYKAVKT